MLEDLKVKKMDVSIYVLKHNKHEKLVLTLLLHLIDP